MEKLQSSGKIVCAIFFSVYSDVTLKSNSWLLSAPIALVLFFVLVILRIPRNSISMLIYNIQYVYKYIFRIVGICKKKPNCSQQIA